MATVNGSYVTNTWNGLTRSWRARMDYSVSETTTTYTINVTWCGIHVKSSNAYFNAKTMTTTVSGALSASYLNASAKDVSSSSDWKLNSGTISVTFNKTSSAQSKTVSLSVKSSSTNAWKGTSTCSFSVTIPALLPATLSFDGNGNTGGTAPSSISTYQNVSTQLPSSTDLTKTGFNFNGWNTDSAGTGTTYGLGAYYTPTSSSATFYAKWVSNYVAPIITGLRSYRVVNDATGVNPGVSTSGVRGYCDFEVVSGQHYTVTSVIMKVLIDGLQQGSDISMTKTANKWYGYTPNPDDYPALDLDTDKMYAIRIIATLVGEDGVTRTIPSSGTLETYISKEAFVIDVNEDGTAVAFFGVAPDGEEGLYIGSSTDTADMNISGDESVGGDLTVGGAENVDGDLTIGGTVNGYNFATNNVLWTGAYYMTDGHTATLSNKVSEQVSGIVLVWSYYSSGTAQNWDWNYIFVPKWHAAVNNGNGVDCFLTANAAAAHKYVYVYDDKIVGHAQNTGSRTIAGVSCSNSSYVLRAVIGV